MLNVKKLSELLANNVNPNIYPRMFIMSPNGTLLAYSRPVDIKELRDQAALISMAWKEHETALAQRVDRESSNAHSHDTEARDLSLETLTIEFETNNLIVRALQKNLLFVLVGSIPHEPEREFKMTAEVHGDPRYPHALANYNQAPAMENNSEPPASQLAMSPSGSHMSLRDKDLKVGALHIQRKKLDALTKYLRSEFDARGFVMPSDGAFP